MRGKIQQVATVAVRICKVWFFFKEMMYCTVRIWKVRSYVNMIYADAGVLFEVITGCCKEWSPYSMLDVATQCWNKVPISLRLESGLLLVTGQVFFGVRSCSTSSQGAMRGWFDLINSIWKLFRKDIPLFMYDLSFKSCSTGLPFQYKYQLMLVCHPWGQWKVSRLSLGGISMDHRVSSARGRTLFLKWCSFEACESTILHRHQHQSWFGSCWSLVFLWECWPLF